MKPIWKVEDARLALLKRLDGSALTAEDSGMKKRVNRSTLQTPGGDKPAACAPVAPLSSTAGR